MLIPLDDCRLYPPTELPANSRYVDAPEELVYAKNRVSSLNLSIVKYWLSRAKPEEYCDVDAFSAQTQFPEESACAIQDAPIPPAPAEEDPKS